MSLLDLVGDRGTDSKINGVVVGIVTNNKDPEDLGRVRVKFPWLSNEDESNWARIGSLMAGKERGIFILPEIDDEVLSVGDTYSYTKNIDNIENLKHWASILLREN